MKKTAANSFAEGDTGAAAAYAEKLDVKAQHKKFRRIYDLISPSEQSPKLRNSVTRSAVKKVMHGAKNEPEQTK